MFEAILAGDLPYRIVHVVGPGGIGKSTLLREVVRRATTKGFSSVWIDGRDIAPFPHEINDMVASLTEGQPALVVLDSYGMIASLDGYLRESVIPDLPDSTVVVFASRHAPSPHWFERGWDSVVCSMELTALTPAESEALASAHGAVGEVVGRIVQRSHGSPLAIVVAAENRGSVALGDLVDRLLGDEADPSQLRTLGVAAIARVTTPELLEDVLGETAATEGFKWLAARSFSEPLATGVALHALVAEAVQAQLEERDPVGAGMLRRRIADHLHRRALAGDTGLSTELQHLVRDPDVKWGFANDIGNRFHIDRIRPGDTDQIGAIMEFVGESEWWASSLPYIEGHPELCGVARDGDGRVGGYFVAVSPDTAPAIARTDPALMHWLDYVRDELRTSSAVLWREAIDLTGGVENVTALLGAGGLLATGVANPRYGFLPISPLTPAARQFSVALSATHVPELDIHAFGQVLECHIVDFGPGGLLGFQRDWIYRETGAAPPVDVGDVEPLAILKMLREPESLAHGPGWLGASPSARLERLKSLVSNALSVFGDHRDDQLARRIIEVAYLGENAPHDAVARQLHLSRSTYFRRLQSASERVSEELAAIMRGDR